MKSIIHLFEVGKRRIFIRNRYNDWFFHKWHLISIEREWLQDRKEYRFCLIGFELVVLVRTN